MKENPILSRIKILKVIFEDKISQRKLAEKLKVHFNTINNIIQIFKKRNKE